MLMFRLFEQNNGVDICLQVNETWKGNGNYKYEEMFKQLLNI